MNSHLPVRNIPTLHSTSTQIDEDEPKPLSLYIYIDTLRLNTLMFLNNNNNDNDNNNNNTHTHSFMNFEHHGMVCVCPCFTHKPSFGQALQCASSIACATLRIASLSERLVQPPRLQIFWFCSCLCFHSCLLGGLLVFCCLCRWRLNLWCRKCWLCWSFCLACLLSCIMCMFFVVWFCSCLCFQCRLQGGSLHFGWLCRWRRCSPKASPQPPKIAASGLPVFLIIWLKP